MGCLDSVDWNGGMEMWNGMELDIRRQFCGRVRPLTLLKVQSERKC